MMYSCVAPGIAMGALVLLFATATGAAVDRKSYSGLGCKTGENVDYFDGNKFSYRGTGSVEITEGTQYAEVVCPVLRDIQSSVTQISDWDVTLCSSTGGHAFYVRLYSNNINGTTGSWETFQVNLPTTPGCYNYDGDPVTQLFEGGYLGLSVETRPGGQLASYSIQEEEIYFP